MERINIEKIDRGIKIWLLIISLITLIVLGIAALQENVLVEWRKIRQGYTEILEDKATDERGKKFVNQFEVRIVQNFVPELNVVDRCVTCHTGVDDPRMTDQPQPYATHPGNYLNIHPPGKFGCTICHQGQGRATETVDAHGEAPHWDYPLLRGPFVKSSCTKCHADQDLYGKGGLIVQASNNFEADKTLAFGKHLFENKGCLGCHSLNGKGGGAIGTDLTNEGEKTVHEFDFSHLLHDNHDAEKTVINWHKEHFKNPAAIVADSQMPDMNFSDEEAEALTAYILTFRKKVKISTYETPTLTANSHKPTGKQLYGIYCSACHGVDGIDSEVPTILTPALNNRDTLATADDDYYRFIIHHGRSNSDMPSWDENGGNLSREEVDLLVGYLRSWEKEGAPLRDVSARSGDVRIGKAYYDGNCMNCHGPNGEGGIGNKLNSLTFLAVVSDEFLAETIIKGRPGTAMASWKHLPAEAISDLLAYIRSWQPEKPSWEKVKASLDSEDKATAVHTGKILYRSNCASCHGNDGESGIGPTLNSPGVLNAVDDKFLYHQIVDGRPSTAMPAWTYLSAQNIASVISYLRSMQPNEPLKLASVEHSGDYTVGKVLYDVACLQCHGDRAQGGVGPQLANPVFLKTVSNETLNYWIAHGRSGTAMKGFITEEQGVTKLTSEQIAHVIAYIRYEGMQDERPILRTGVGDPHVGQQLFAGSCISCHGNGGEGSSGPQLNNPNFLATASDGFLAATIILGRTDTPMRSMVHGQQGVDQISPKNVQDIIAYMRMWDYPQSWLRPRPIAEMSTRAINAGREHFANYCAGCHGPDGLGQREGEGYHAPALNNPEFLSAASDGFLLATIARGRSNTPMRPFGRNSGGIADLSASDITDIVSFIRTWQEKDMKKSSLSKGESKK